MKIALIGYGKMGHEIESIALDKGHEITIRSCAHKPFKPVDLEGTDVAIEFSQPDVAVDNILKCFEANCPVVVGTTGWYTRLPEVRNIALNQNQSILFSTNFSIGVQVVFHINRELARIMNRFSDYEPSIHEIHHIQKLDKPSGTAITLAEGIIENLPVKKSWISDNPGSVDELSIISERINEVPGTHHIKYESAVDIITLSHQAKNRKGFASGAVLAAEWLKARKGVFSMSDFLSF